MTIRETFIAFAEQIQVNLSSEGVLSPTRRLVKFSFQLKKWESIRNWLAIR